MAWAGFILSENWRSEWYYWRRMLVLLAAGLFLPDPGASAGAHVASPPWPWQPGLVPQFRAGLSPSELHRLECSGLEVWKSVRYRAGNWEFRNLFNSHNSHWVFCWLQWKMRFQCCFQNNLWFQSVSAWLSVAVCFAVYKDLGTT